MPTAFVQLRQMSRWARSGRCIDKAIRPTSILHDIPLALGQDGQLQVGMAGQSEGHLLVAEKAFQGMIECPLAAFPPEHHTLLPVSLERFTALVQVLDETVNGRIVQVRTYVGAKFRNDASGAIRVVMDKRARRWFEKDEAQ